MADSTSSPPELPRIDGHELVREIGRGAMGAVYEARDLALQRRVAVKLLLRPGFVSPETLARFRHEAEAVARLNHPNVVRIFASGRTDDQPWFSMEFIDRARPLSPAVAEGKDGPRRAAALVAKLARAVHHAHENGIVHRDLKPANILLGQDGEPHVTDFGVAKWYRPAQDGASKALTVKGSLLGTVGYMAPEQALGEVDRVGPRTDVWALGVVLYELLTGRLPFQGAHERETIGRIVRDEAPSPAWIRPESPPDLETICGRCLRKDPAARYASAAELAEDLEAVAQGAPLPSRAETPDRKGWLSRLLGGG